MYDYTLIVPNVIIARFLTSREYSTNATFSFKKDLRTIASFKSSPIFSGWAEYSSLLRFHTSGKVKIYAANPICDTTGKCSLTGRFSPTNCCAPREMWLKNFKFQFENVNESVPILLKTKGHKFFCNFFFNNNYIFYYYYYLFCMYVKNKCQNS